MDFNAIVATLEQELSPKRFRHTLGVVSAAEKLAERYEADVDKARLAALLHDCCKEYPIGRLQDMLRLEGGPYADERFLMFPPLLHGPAGAIRAAERFGVLDYDVLEAIRVHTTGKPHMSLLDKIVFLADYIEPNRKFPGVKELRDWAKQDLDRAVLEGYDLTIRHLLEEYRPIYEGTLAGRNNLLETLRQRGQLV